MEKLEQTLTNLLESDLGKGCCISTVCAILKSSVLILQFLHQEYHLLYVDFSISNIAFHHKDGMRQAYMIDFGSLHEVISFSPSAKTLRYCSANTIADRTVFERDDLESLGFVLFDAYFGLQQSPLNQALPSEVTKQQLCRDACHSKYGVFFSGILFTS